MLAERRRQEIIKYINETGSCTIHELKEKFDVTLMTINRDLKKLGKLNKLNVVRGGALSKGSQISEKILSQRLDYNLKEKKIIAEKAIKFIKSGDSIMLDASTTSIVLAERIKFEEIENLTVITNSCIIINDLLPNENITVLSTGGTLLRKFHCFVGPIAESIVSSLRVDKFFFSAGAVSINGDITDTDLQEVSLKKKMIDVSNKTILAIESNKFNKTGLYKIIDLEKVDVLIKDNEKSSDQFIQRIKDKSIDHE